MTRLCLLLLLTLPAAAQPEVTLTLANKDNRTQFHQGEAIELQLKFQSSVPGKYAVWPRQTYRVARRAEHDTFTAEPAPGAVDPLADCPDQVSGEAIVGPIPVPTPLDEPGVAVTLTLNEWIAFRRPGHYRVSVETTRLVTRTAPGVRLPMKSGLFEFDVTPFDAAWAADQLQRAVAVLDIPDPGPGRIGQRGPSFEQMEAARLNTENAARIVRILETPEAARAVVRYLGSGPQYAKSQLRAAIFATPRRMEVLAALDDAVAAPDVPITQELFTALLQLTEVANLGPLPTMKSTERAERTRFYQEVQAPYRERAKPFDDAVTARLITALSHKRGEALAISVATVSMRGTQILVPALSRAVLENLAAMPENTQRQWLTSYWPRIATPEVKPILMNLASGAGNLRDIALSRLAELDPAAARPIALDRIRRADISRNDRRSLLELPDKTLPDLDDALAANFERGIVNADVLLARYASAGAAARVKAYLVRNPYICNGPIMAYLYRVDPGFAAQHLAQARAGRGCSLTDLQSTEDLLMSPALEKQLIEDLLASPSHAGAIASLLQNAGSAAAKEPLLEAMKKPVTGPVLPPGVTLESNLGSYVLEGVGWLPTDANLDKILAACQGDNCRRSATSFGARMAEPLAVSAETSFAGIVYARVGPFMLRSHQQLKDKIAQFPKGTGFYLHIGYAGGWWAEQKTREFKEIVESAGMKLVPEPPRPTTPLPH